MNDKHFIINDIHFTQRVLDGYVDVTQICQSKKKMFANWSRSKKAKEVLDQYENALYQTNRHTWMIVDCLPDLLKWILKKEFNFDEIRQELVKPFVKIEETDKVTTKVCSKCHEELSLDSFWNNKRINDGLDRICINCYKQERKGNSKYAERSLEYYYKNSEKANKRKGEWNKANKEKVNEANRRAYQKKKAIEADKIETDAIKKSELITKEGENIINNITLLDKNDNPYTLICREEDGYINVTSLCKASGKKFNDWFRLKRTTEYLEILSTQIGIPIIAEPTEKPESQFRDVALIKYNYAYGEDRCTWVDPKIAINIAQWISPQFNVQILDLINQLYVIGHVRLTDKSDSSDIIDIHKTKIKHKILLSEDKIDEADNVKENLIKKLELLEDKNKELMEEHERLSRYLVKRPRIKYDKGNVIYILKHEEFKDCYKVGITNNLTSRMSSYQTCAPKNYQVVYHTYTDDNSLLEVMVRTKMIDYLYAHNKEWYEIKEGPDILIKAIELGATLLKN